MSSPAKNCASISPVPNRKGVHDSRGMLYKECLRSNLGLIKSLSELSNHLADEFLTYGYSLYAYLPLTEQLTPHLAKLTPRPAQLTPQNFAAP